MPAMEAFASHDTDRRTSPAQRRYALILLTAAYTLNYFDRSIVNVLLDSIKLELKLTDTALGFIAGFGFAILYTVLGIPFARLADLKGRRPVIAFGVALWSLMTAIGGLAQTGAQLALARTGVGIGEAAGTAPSVAMISDLFDKDERPRALSILNIGIPVGILLGIGLGGVANQLWGWRAALCFAGVPGLIVAALLQFTVAEPSRAAPGLQPKAAEPVGSTLAFLFRQPTYVLCLGGSFFSGFAINGLLVWAPAFSDESITSCQLSSAPGWAARSASPGPSARSWAARSWRATARAMIGGRPPNRPSLASRPFPSRSACFSPTVRRSRSRASRRVPS